MSRNAWAIAITVMTCRLAAADSAPLLKDLKNATYSGFDAVKSPVTLKDGRWESTAKRQSITLVGDMRAVGDLNGDGAEEAVVLLAEGTGGSGERIYAAVVSNQNSRFRNVATALVGDRVKPRWLRISDRAILLDVVQAGASEPMCCPTELATRSFVLEGGALHERPAVRTGKLGPEAMSGPEWVLGTLSAAETMPEKPRVTLRFEHGQFAGNGGCNRYSAGVTPGQQTGEINIKAVISTRMACSQPAMSIESRFLRQLQGVKTYTFFAGQLVLTYEVNGKQGEMKFEPAGTK
jgi:heat shock protein HslJ